ncbi:uncharacterized protein LOC141699659 [Apium graveolens]|uniref:uncharacterized protein LOC141699659 n=1 Tax=Apium graveolens TaxID=4045 RepID=UPI003D7ADD77
MATSASASPKFHSALTITNVKSLVPITLDNEQGLYHSWATLFTNLARRLDAVVLQWIYGTISNDLLHAILKRNDTAEGAWNRLEALFQDNKASRATHLEEEFTNSVFENFTSMDNYCNHLQSLADILADVDAPVNNGRLVLRHIGSLPEAYSGTVDFIQNQEPLPSFESCRSRLKMVERTVKARHVRETGGSGSKSCEAAMVVADSSVSSDSSARNKRNNNNKGKNVKNGGMTKAQQHFNGVGPGKTPYQHQQYQSRQQSVPQQWPGWGGWTIPPCPFPAYSWQPRPNAAANRPPSSKSGLLGPRPQAFNVAAPPAPNYMPTTPSYTPTDIEAAMHALSFSQPDGNYYMDTGATSHMTADAGIFSSYVNSSNKHHNIVVGSGDLIPVVGHGYTTLPPPYPPFTLNHMLYAPKLIKNLISVRQFTSDNKVSISFDPFGFSVNDL